MLRLLHVSGESLQRLVTLLAPDTLEHVLYPGALRGLADPLGLPGTPGGRGGRAGLGPPGEVEEPGQVGAGLAGLLHLIEK